MSNYHKKVMHEYIMTDDKKVKLTVTSNILIE